MCSLHVNKQLNFFSSVRVSLSLWVDCFWYSW